MSFFELLQQPPQHQPMGPDDHQGPDSEMSPERIPPGPIKPFGKKIWPLAPTVSIVSGALNYLKYDDVSLGVADYWAPVIYCEGASVLTFIGGGLMSDMWFTMMLADTIAQGAALGLVFRANSNLDYSPANDGVMPSMILHSVGLFLNLYGMLTNMTFDWCHSGYPEKCAEGELPPPVHEEDSNDYYYYGYY